MSSKRNHSLLERRALLAACGRARSLLAQRAELGALDLELQASCGAVDVGQVLDALQADGLHLHREAEGFYFSDCQFQQTRHFAAASVAGREPLPRAWMSAKPYTPAVLDRIAAGEFSRGSPAS